MNPLLSNDLKNGGFPNIANVEHREGREYITAGCVRASTISAMKHTQTIGLCQPSPNS